MSNDVKPRYDGGGSAFGQAHRNLPKYCGMFDIDGGKAEHTVQMTLRKENVGYFEYRHNFDTGEYTYPAFFEVKHHMSQSVVDAMTCRAGTALSAEINLAKMVGARFFIIVEDNGHAPFHVYERDHDTGNWHDYGWFDGNTIHDKWQEMGLV